MARRQWRSFAPRVMCQHLFGLTDSRPARQIVAALLGTLTGLLIAAPLLAHGGTLVFSGRAGPYDVRADALREGDRLDYSVEVRYADSGEYYKQATLTLVATGRDGTAVGTWPVPLAGLRYELVLPIPDRVNWQVELRIEGPLGPAVVQHRLVLEPDIGWAAPSLVALAVLGTVVGGHMLRHRVLARRRR